MLNITFKGHLIDLEGHDLSNYEVVIYYLDSKLLVPDRKLGRTTTDIRGYFKYVYSHVDETLFNDNSSKIKLKIVFKYDIIFETTFTAKLKGEVIDFGVIQVKGPNRGVKGRILDEKGKPLSDLIVQALGAGKIESSIQDSNSIKLADKLSPISLKKDYGLGKSITDKNGYYEILYPPSEYSGFFNEKPDIWVVVRDVLDVCDLFRTEKFSDVSESIKKIEDIVIKRSWAEGWYVTLGGSQKSRFTSDNHVEVLIDNKSELESLVQSINNSKSFIYLTQFEFDTDFVATFTSSGDELVPKDVLVEVLKEADDRGVNVKIILNENLAVPDSYNDIKNFFKPTGVEVREFKSTGLHVMHAKTMIVDGREAFVIGSPFKQDYWDTSQHLINDPRREPALVRPVHDVSVKLMGGSVKYVEEFFIEMWNYISEEDYHGKGKLDPHTITMASEDGRPVQIARSVTPETLTKKGELGIFEAYRKAIPLANDYIYIENQFFTNSSIIKALKNAMDADDDLQIIVVMNENPDIPGYKEWQNKGIKKLGIKSVNDSLEHPQIGVFTLWSAGFGEEQFEIQPIYVHTKLAVIDDIWATVGTANMDGSSLTYVNELKGFFDVNFHRNMEMNVIIPEVENNLTDEVVKLRNSLWNEHLGINISHKLPDHGWLEIWQKTAHENIKSLNKKKPYLNGQILPYSLEKTVKDQLDDLNINTEGWNLLESD